MAKYNGHKNWNHWNVSLWLNNDEGLYRHARALARRHGIGEGAALLAVDLHGQKTPDGAPYSFSSIRAAMRGIL